MMMTIVRFYQKSTDELADAVDDIHLISQHLNEKHKKRKNTKIARHNDVALTQIVNDVNI